MGRLQTYGLGVLVAVGSILSERGQARTNTVLNLRDGLSAGTLRSAIVNALPGDVIRFSNGLAGTISLTNGGQLLINKDLRIIGPGAKVITVSGNNSRRVFNVTNATVTISGLTIARGRVVGTNGAPGVDGGTVYGAGILNLNTATNYSLTVADCAFVQNAVIGGVGGGVFSGGGSRGGEAYGGAIFGNGVLTARNCLFAGNTVTGGNGGAGSLGGGTGGAALGAGLCNLGRLSLVNCTFATNIARGGSGGSTSSGSLTFPGPGGNAEGAALFSVTPFAMLSCTVASNTATGGTGGTGGISGGSRGGAFGGGVRAAAGTFEIRNTIIAANVALDARDVSGDFASQGFNLVGVTNGSTGFSAAFDQSGNTNGPIDPRLSPLQDYGGATRTFALRTNSTAIDAGQSFGLSDDQRGAPRPADFLGIVNPGDGSDIGAFESIPAVLSITRFSNNSVLCWSVYNPGYTLQSITNLTSSNWTSVSGSPVTIDKRFYLTNANSGRYRFFRLRAP